MTREETRLLTAWRREVRTEQCKLKREADKIRSSWERETQLCDRALSALLVVYRHQTQGTPEMYPSLIRKVLVSGKYLTTTGRHLPPKRYCVTKG